MSRKDSITAIVLAAGKGTRMKSDKAKVLHEVFYKSMLRHVLDALHTTPINKCLVIIGHQSTEVAKSIADYNIETVIQEKQLGTGHAVLCAEQKCDDADMIMILCGDTPLVRDDTLNEMINSHRKSGAALTLMTTTLDNPFGYGRVIGDEHGNILEIVEEKDASDEQRRIREINAGIYLVKRDFLFNALKEVGTDNSQGEVYLTDIVAIAVKRGLAAHKFHHSGAIDVLGVNSRLELAQAHHELQKRRNRALMRDGVTVYGPESVYVAPDIPVGRDTIIHPGVQIKGNSRIGKGCVLEAGAQLANCQLGDNVIVGVHSVLQGCRIPDNEQIAPQTGLFE